MRSSLAFTDSDMTPYRSSWMIEGYKLLKSKSITKSLYKPACKEKNSDTKITQWPTRWFWTHQSSNVKAQIYCVTKNHSHFLPRVHGFLVVFCGVKVTCLKLSMNDSLGDQSKTLHNANKIVQDGIHCRILLYSDCSYQPKLPSKNNCSVFHLTSSNDDFLKFHKALSKNDCVIYMSKAKHAWSVSVYFFVLHVWEPKRPPRMLV